MLDVDLLPAFESNYIFLATEPRSGVRVVVDPGEAGPVEDALSATGGRLDMILLTHHHGDHTGGVERLKDLTGARVVGNAADASRLPPLDLAVSAGQTLAIGALEAKVLDTPGHTLGHIAYHLPGDDTGTGQLFSGDTLFVLGCGRVFEGTLPQMWESLSQLAALAPDTLVYCAHEYAEANARFAESLFAESLGRGEDPALSDAIAAIRDARGAGRPTVPTTIQAETAANPFLRGGDPRIAAALGQMGRPAADVFAEIRRRKDSA